MAAGTATNLLPTVAAVMSLFNKRTFTANDYIRIPDVPGGLIVQ
ncbi:phage tail protein, partial [Yersinia sp. 1252 StPb PI]